MALLSNKDVHDYNTRNRDHLIICYNINKKVKYSTVSTPKVAKLIESGGSKNMYTTRLSKAEKEKKLQYNINNVGKENYTIQYRKIDK